MTATLPPASSLAHRLDTLGVLHGAAVAQYFLRTADPDAPARAISFSEFATQVRRRANALSALGIGRGDIVAFLAPLGETAYPSLIGLMVAATVAPVNYFLKPEALIRLIRASGAKALLTAAHFDDDPDALGKIAAIKQAIPDLRHIVFGEGDVPAGAIDLERLASDTEGGAWAGDADGENLDRVVALFHTGGTTGLPKLVPHTERMYLAMLDSCGAAEGARCGDVMLSPLPLFHTSGVLQAGLVPLLNGTTIVIPSSKGFRDPNTVRNYWRFVARYRVTIGAAVPTTLAALAATAPDCDVTSLRRLLCGGAPVSPTTIETIARMTQGAEVIEGWGMTETCGFSVMNPHGQVRLGSVGRPFPGVEVQIRRADANGDVMEICATDVIGELVVRGNIVIPRYADPKPGQFTPDGWLRTGDLARIDETGYLWVTGRVKDLIIRGGHNIDPAIIEEPAYQHPAVQLAAAVGKPDKYAGELPILFVQLKAGVSVDPGELGEFVAARVVERAAAPKEIYILDAIPLTGPGKISKLDLRREATRAVFQRDVDGVLMSEDIPVTVTVVDDDKLGTVAVLTSAGQPNSKMRERIDQALNGYAIPFRWS